MKFRFAPRAAQDFIAIADYIHERSPRAALRIRAAILDAIRTIAQFPQAGRQQKFSGVRKLMTRNYPYIVYYALDDATDEIVVVAIQHASREREHSDA